MCPCFSPLAPRPSPLAPRTPRPPPLALVLSSHNFVLHNRHGVLPPVLGFSLCPAECSDDVLPPVLGRGQRLEVQLRLEVHCLEVRVSAVSPRVRSGHESSPTLWMVFSLPPAREQSPPTCECASGTQPWHPFLHRLHRVAVPTCAGSSLTLCLRRGTSASRAARPARAPLTGVIPSDFPVIPTDSQ